MKLNHLHESNKQQEGVIDRAKARFSGAKEWIGQVGKNTGQAWRGSKDPMGDPSSESRAAKIQSIAASKAKEILTDWYKLGLIKNPPNETNIQRATDAFIALLNSKTSKGKQYSAQSAAKSLAGKMSGVSVTENLDEGWLDRAKANLSGYGAKATTGVRNVAGNLGSIFGGSGGKAMDLQDSDTAQKQAKVKSIAFSSAKNALQDWYKLGLLSSLNDRDIQYLGNQFVQILSGIRKASTPAKPAAAKPAAAKPAAAKPAAAKYAAAKPASTAKPASGGKPASTAKPASGGKKTGTFDASGGGTFPPPFSGGSAPASTGAGRGSTGGSGSGSPPSFSGGPSSMPSGYSGGPSGYGVGGYGVGGGGGGGGGEAGRESVGNVTQTNTQTVNVNIGDAIRQFMDLINQKKEESPSGEAVLEPEEIKQNRNAIGQMILSKHMNDLKKTQSSSAKLLEQIPAATNKQGVKNMIASVDKISATVDSLLTGYGIPEPKAGE